MQSGRAEILFLMVPESVVPGFPLRAVCKLL